MKHHSKWITIASWASVALGTALWTYGYFASGSPSLVAWGSILPKWAADTLPNLEAEVGILLVLVASIPLCREMWRDSQHAEP